MIITHLSVVLIFFATAFFLCFVLYLLSCVFVSVGIEEELQIERLYAYECGYGSFSDARDAFDIKFYLVAVLFLIFDLEISFFLPLSVTLNSLEQIDFIVILAFIFILTLGFVYEWKKGGLDW